ncbi:MAG: hypothetical protein HDQ91_00905 [Desulfovibrio sp.]|nr:hypothetical protein [Desulfovibrio sp.]
MNKYEYEYLISYGSSGGGYAALKISEFLSCNAIAINPQIYLDKYKYWKDFCLISGFDRIPYDKRRFELNLSPTCKYLIIQNDSDEHHCIHHLFPFIKNKGIFPKYGLTGNENIWIWLYHAFGGHDVQEDEYLLTFILWLNSQLPPKSREELMTLDNLATALSGLWARYRWQCHLNNLSK